MTILTNPPQPGDRPAATRWFRSGHKDETTRHTDAWEHETFGEEQARWERDDPEYARVCEAVRQAKAEGEQASLSADKTKAEWDARVATQRQANDDAQKLRHALTGAQMAKPDTTSSRTVSSRATEHSTPTERPDAPPGDRRSRSSQVHATPAGTCRPRDETVLFAWPTKPREL